MKITRVTDQHRNDFSADLECEHCGAKDKLTTGYDDRNYHENVIPRFFCPVCRKNREGINREDILITKIAELQNRVIALSGEVATLSGQKTELIEAGKLQSEIISDAQKILEEYLLPEGGIEAAMCSLLGLLDSSKQRHAQKAWDAIIARCEVKS